MKRVLLGLLAFSFFIGCASMSPESSWEQDYQAYADKVRINDVHTIVDLVIQYHKKTGFYPLADGSHPLPVYVAITNKKEYIKTEFVDKDIFISAIKSVLGKDVLIPMDPQNYDVYGARFYLYSTDGDNFQISARLFKPTPLTQPIDKYTHLYLMSVHEDIPLVDNHNKENSFVSFADASSCVDYGNLNFANDHDITLIPLPFLIRLNEEGKIAKHYYPFTENKIDRYIVDSIASKNNVVIIDEKHPRVDAIKLFLQGVMSNVGGRTDSPLLWGYDIPEETLDKNSYIYFPIGIERESNRHTSARLYILIANSVGKAIYARWCSI